MDKSLKALMDLTDSVGQQPPGGKVMSESSHISQVQGMGQVTPEMMELMTIIGVKRERQEYPNLYR